MGGFEPDEERTESSYSGRGNGPGAWSGLSILSVNRGGATIFLLSVTPAMAAVSALVSHLSNTEFESRMIGLTGQYQELFT